MNINNNEIIEIQYNGYHFKSRGIATVLPVVSAPQMQGTPPIIADEQQILDLTIELSNKTVAAEILWFMIQNTTRELPDHRFTETNAKILKEIEELEERRKQILEGKPVDSMSAATEPATMPLRTELPQAANVLRFSAVPMTTQLQTTTQLQHSSTAKETSCAPQPINP